jgi:hypothetical protein
MNSGKAAASSHALPGCMASPRSPLRSRRLRIPLPGHPGRSGRLRLDSRDGPRRRIRRRRSGDHGRRVRSLALAACPCRAPGAAPRESLALDRRRVDGGASPIRAAGSRSFFSSSRCSGTPHRRRERREGSEFLCRSRFRPGCLRPAVPTPRARFSGASACARTFRVSITRPNGWCRCSESFAPVFRRRGPPEDDRAEACRYLQRIGWHP